MDSKFINAKELATALGIELSTFKQLVYSGQLPRPIAITGKKLKKWLRRDIDGMAYILEMRPRMKEMTADEQEQDAD